MTPTKGIHLLISGTNKYVIFNGKKDFADEIKLMISRCRDYTGFSKWIQCNHKTPHKKEAERSALEKAM